MDQPILMEFLHSSDMQPELCIKQDSCSPKNINGRNSRETIIGAGRVLSFVV